MNARSSERGTSARFERACVVCAITCTGASSEREEAEERPSQAESSESLECPEGGVGGVVVRREKEVGRGAYLASKCCWKRACRLLVVEGEVGSGEDS